MELKNVWRGDIDKQRAASAARHAARVPHRFHSASRTRVRARARSLPVAVALINATRAFLLIGQFAARSSPSSPMTMTHAITRGECERTKKVLSDGRFACRRLVCRYDYERARASNWRFHARGGGRRCRRQRDGSERARVVDERVLSRHRAAAFWAHKNCISDATKRRAASHSFFFSFLRARCFTRAIKIACSRKVARRKLRSRARAAASFCCCLTRAVWRSMRVFFCDERRRR